MSDTKDPRRDELVYAVTYVDPPTLDIDGGIVKPSSWARTAHKTAIGINENLERGKIVQAVRCPVGGLAAVISVPRRKVVGYHNASWIYRDNDSNDDGHEYAPTRPKVHAICAHIKWNCEGREKVPGLNLWIELLRNVELESFELLHEGGGCNPGTLLYFPNAPKFSKRIYAERKRHLISEGLIWLRLFEAVPKITEFRQARDLFPDFDFTPNRKLERALKPLPEPEKELADV